MTRLHVKPAMHFGILLTLSTGIFPCGSAALTLHPLAAFPIPSGPLAIIRPVEDHKPFTVAGEEGAILGEQNGRFEAWLYPVKILSDFRITAELADYPVPIDV